METSNKTSFIIVCGVFILMVFTYVSTVNLLPDNLKSEAYYAKIEEDMTSKIEYLNYENGILTITTSGDTAKYCAKTTKTTPMKDSLCWNTIENNTASMSVFVGKKYYVWLKDENGKISSPREIKTSMS